MTICNTLATVGTFCFHVLILYRVVLGNVSAIAYGSGGVSEPGIKLYDSDIYNARTIILNTINFLWNRPISIYV